MEEDLNLNMTASQQYDLEQIMKDVVPFGIDHSTLGIQIESPQTTTVLHDGTQFCDGGVKYEYHQDSSLSATGNMPYLERFGGQYGFELVLSSAHSKKNSWIYSPILEKVFIDMNKNLLVQFHINNNRLEYQQPLSVRALLVYSSSDFINLPVNRCVVHSLESDCKSQAHCDNLCNCAQFEYVGHVLRSSCDSAIYCYDPQSKRHSVLVPVGKPQAGSDTITIPYYFTCKTSCPTGMQRRDVSVVFTLENYVGEVVGRTVLPVKICSCPKRDKERMEKDYMVNNNNDSARKKLMDTAPPALTPPPNKKLKCGHPDTLPINKAEQIEQIQNNCKEIEIMFQQLKQKYEEMEQYVNQFMNTFKRKYEEISEQMSQLLNTENALS